MNASEWLGPINKRFEQTILFTYKSILCAVRSQSIHLILPLVFDDMQLIN